MGETGRSVCWRGVSSRGRSWARGRDLRSAGWRGVRARSNRVPSRSRALNVRWTRAGAASETEEQAFVVRSTRESGQPAGIARAWAGKLLPSAGCADTGAGRAMWAGRRPLVASALPSVAGRRDWRPRWTNHSPAKIPVATMPSCGRHPSDIAARGRDRIMACAPPVQGGPAAYRGDPFHALSGHLKRRLGEHPKLAALVRRAARARNATTGPILPSESQIDEALRHAEGVWTNAALILPGTVEGEACLALCSHSHICTKWPRRRRPAPHPGRRPPSPARYLATSASVTRSNARAASRAAGCQR